MRPVAFAARSSNKHTAAPTFNSPVHWAGSNSRLATAIPLHNHHPKMASSLGRLRGIGRFLRHVRHLRSSWATVLEAGKTRTSSKRPRSAAHGYTYSAPFRFRVENAVGPQSRDRRGTGGGRRADEGDWSRAMGLGLLPHQARKIRRNYRPTSFDKLQLGLRLIKSTPKRAMRPPGSHEPNLSSLFCCD